MHLAIEIDDTLPNEYVFLRTRGEEVRVTISPGVSAQTLAFLSPEVADLIADGIDTSLARGKRRP